MNINSNDILKIVIKYHIYEFCIDLLFKNIQKNFPRTKIMTVPLVGERFVSIHDKENGDTYFNCTIIRPKDLEIYDEMEYNEIKEIVIAIKFVRSEYDNDVIERNAEQYFSREEFKNLIFTK